MKKIVLFLLMAVWGNTTLIAQHSDTLNPVADVYLVTFGGGQGKNTLMKFDISSITVNSVVSSAVLEVYVTEKAINWDGDMKFMNVNSQGWLESDQETTLWNLIRTDTVMQLMNFGATTGWASSVDIKKIFNKDYIQGNTYCTIQLKDPDDPTMAPAMGNPAYDSDDSLMSGNIFNDHIIYPPHEYTDQSLIPRLIINYTVAPDIFVQPMNGATCEGNNTMFNVQATGDALCYQWQHNGSNISGATTSSYSISPVTLADAGNYQCIIVNPVGADTSNIAVLTVNPLPVVYDMTGGGSYCAGGTGVPVGLSGSDIGVNYMFFCNGNYTGITMAGTGSPLSIGNQTTEGCYIAYASNATTFCQEVMNDSACVNINPLPGIIISSLTDTLCPGDNTTLTANANGGCPPYTYQWSMPPGGTTQSINVSPPSTTTYCITVTDCNGCSNLACYTVVVDPCTGITEFNNDINVYCFPNPFSSTAQIISDKNLNNAEINVFDVLGNKVKTVYNISGRSFIYERDGLRSGKYFYRITEGGMKIAAGRFIVN